MEVIHYDEEDRLWTMYSTKRGGPIVTADTEELVRSEFDRAQKLTNAIEKFMYWKKHGVWKMS